MEIRKTGMEDLPGVLDLYEQARQFMRENGNPNQWGSANPPAERVKQDIEEGKSYLCVEDGEILGVFYFSDEVDHSYDHIYEGAWRNDEPYSVIHRVACPGKRRGIGTFCVKWCMAHCDGNLRIDTHRDNRPMQGMLEKNGFVRCGIIHLANGDERLAYHWCEKQAKSVEI